MVECHLEQQCHSTHAAQHQSHSGYIRGHSSFVIPTQSTGKANVKERTLKTLSSTIAGFKMFFFLSSSQVSPSVLHMKNHEHSDGPCGPREMVVVGETHRNRSHRRQAAAAPGPSPAPSGEVRKGVARTDRELRQPPGKPCRLRADDGRFITEPRRCKTRRGSRCFARTM